MKEFHVVPFKPIHDRKRRTSLNEVADQLEEIFMKYQEDGWQYERIETISSRVPSKGGCFGFFATPAYDMSNHFIVFSKQI